MNHLKHTALATAVVAVAASAIMALAACSGGGSSKSSANEPEAPKNQVAIIQSANEFDEATVRDLPVAFEFATGSNIDTYVICLGPDEDNLKPSSKVLVPYEPSSKSPDQYIPRNGDNRKWDTVFVSLQSRSNGQSGTNGYTFAIDLNTSNVQHLEYDASGEWISTGDYLTMAAQQHEPATPVTFAVLNSKLEPVYQGTGDSIRWYEEGGKLLYFCAIGDTPTYHSNKWEVRSYTPGEQNDQAECVIDLSQMKEFRYLAYNGTAIAYPSGSSDYVNLMDISDLHDYTYEAPKQITDREAAEIVRTYWESGHANDGSKYHYALEGRVNNPDGYMIRIFVDDPMRVLNVGFYVVNDAGKIYDWNAKKWL